MKCVNSRFFLGVGGVLAAVMLSTLVSTDVRRSLQLSAPLLPGVLLFFIVAEHFPCIEALYWLYLTRALLGLVLSLQLLRIVEWIGVGDPGVWVTAAHIPILLTPNDVTFLAVLSPLSLSLFALKTRSWTGWLALSSFLVSLLTICVLQSRVALCALFVSLAVVTVLGYVRAGLVFIITSIVSFVFIDGFRGFPIVEKFLAMREARIALWMAAWSMFLDAPFLGHGPHTYLLKYRTYLTQWRLPEWFPIEDRLVPWPHNLYLEVLAEQGIIGLIALVFLLACGLLAIRSIQRAPPGEGRLLGVGATAGLSGFCIAALLELSFLRHWVVIALFLLLGIIARIAPLLENEGIELKEE
jgi:O-antigen ligase